MLAVQANQGGTRPGGAPGVVGRLLARATTYTIHPGVAETERAAADPAALDAADVELGDYHMPWSGRA